MMICGSSSSIDDERKRLVVVQHGRHQPGRQPRLMRERQIFVMRARQRQRPAFADEAHIGQRLLDGDAARSPLDDEHEVEVAVADLADRPGGGRSAEPGCDRGIRREIVAQVRLAQNAVFACLAAYPAVARVRSSAASPGAGQRPQSRCGTSARTSRARGSWSRCPPSS